MIGWWTMFVCGAAWAAETPEEDSAYEVVVYADHLVNVARARLIQGLSAHGFTLRVERDDVTILRHEDPWRGEVRLHEDGRFEVRRQPVRVEGREMPWAKKNSVGAWAGCVLWPFMCVRPSGQFVSRRRNLEYRARAVGALEHNTHLWQEALADRAHAAQLELLPDRLVLLWEEGRSLDGTEPLLTPEARRDALYRYWNERTQTPWGEDVRRVIEGFVRSVVQDSDTPFPDSESRWFMLPEDEP